MTTIYIIYPGGVEDDCINEINQLGQFSYPRVNLKDGLFTRKEVFTKLAGFYILEELIIKESKVLPYLKIKSSTGREYTIEAFLTMLEQVDVLR